MGHQTLTPYTRSNRRRASRSFSTPFCTQTTGVDGGATRGERCQRGCAVLGLHRHQHDIVRRDAQLRRRPGHGQIEHGRPGRSSTLSPDERIAVQVCTACDQGDVVAVLGKAGADDPTDGSRAVHHEPHRSNGTNNDVSH